MSGFFICIKRLKKKTKKYLERVGIALSILLNVVLGGPSNQTFSARNYWWKSHDKPNIVWLIDFLIFWDNDHCFNSWIYFKTTKDLRKTHVKNATLENRMVKTYYEVQE